MERKKYPVEQFKMKFVKPTLDREYATRFNILMMHAVIFQITFRRYTSGSTYKLSLVNN